MLFCQIFGAVYFFRSFLRGYGNHAVPPFYCYKAADVAWIAEALADGCNADAPGSFAAWLSQHTPVYAFEMPGKRYDIGDAKSYAQVQEEYRGITIK